MSDLAIKITIVLAAIAVGVASRWIPSSKEKIVVQEASEEVFKDEVMGL